MGESRVDFQARGAQMLSILEGRERLESSCASGSCSSPLSASIEGGGEEVQESEEAELSSKGVCGGLVKSSNESVCFLTFFRLWKVCPCKVG